MSNLHTDPCSTYVFITWQCQSEVGLQHVALPWTQSCLQGLTYCRRYCKYSCGAQSLVIRRIYQPLPYGGNLMSLLGNFRLAPTNSNWTRWLLSISILDRTTNAPSGGKVITFFKVCASVSITCKQKLKMPNSQSTTVQCTRTGLLQQFIT